MNTTEDEALKEIEGLEIHIEWLLQHGSNDEEINARLRYLKRQLKL